MRAAERGKKSKSLCASGGKTHVAGMFRGWFLKKRKRGRDKEKEWSVRRSDLGVVGQVCLVASREDKARHRPLHHAHRVCVCRTKVDCNVREHKSSCSANTPTRPRSPRPRPWIDHHRPRALFGPWTPTPAALISRCKFGWAR